MARSKIRVSTQAIKRYLDGILLNNYDYPFLVQYALPKDSDGRRYLEALIADGKKDEAVSIVKEYLEKGEIDLPSRRHFLKLIPPSAVLIGGGFLGLASANRILDLKEEKKTAKMNLGNAENTRLRYKKTDGRFQQDKDATERIVKDAQQTISNNNSEIVATLLMTTLAGIAVMEEYISSLEDLEKTDKKTVDALRSVTAGLDAELSSKLSQAQKKARAMLKD